MVIKKIAAPKAPGQVGGARAVMSKPKSMSNVGRPTAPEGRPLQWEDMDSHGQAAASEIMADTGNAKSNVSATRAKLTAKQNNPENKPQQRILAGRALGTLGAIEPHLQDTDVSLPRAAQARTDLVRRGADRAQTDAVAHGTSPLREAGAGWYFDHHQDLANIAAKHGVDKERVITASASMSPSNSPANEKTAIDALSELHTSDPTIEAKGAAADKLGFSGKKAFSALSTEQAAGISDTSLRSSIKVHGHEDGGSRILTRLSAGGTRENISKAVDVMRGNTAPDDAIDPHGAPKVWSYRDSIRGAVPGGGVHEEYLTRAHTALFEAKGQDHLDLWGLKDSKEGILNPQKTTAEDTWMGAISSGQQMESVAGASAKPVSPAKFVASEKATATVPKVAVINGKKVSASPDARITGEAVKHSFHNKATRMSAEQLSSDTNHVPATVPQEVAWTQSRIEASKDPQYNQRGDGSDTTAPGGSPLRSLHSSSKLPHVTNDEISDRHMNMQRDQFGKTPRKPKSDERSDRSKEYGTPF